MQRLIVLPGALRAGRLMIALAALVPLLAVSNGLAQGSAPVTAGSRDGTAPRVISPAAATVTLKIRTLDPTNSTAADYIAYFAEQTASLSAGSITIAPILERLPDEEPQPEQKIMQLVAAGETELGLIASRAVDNMGVKSLQALQAPFLITDRALLAKVVTGDSATPMLAGLSAAGVQGLGLWPEDLRHPFSFGTPFLAPADFAGVKIRRLPSVATDRLLAALGAEPVFLNGDPWTAAADGGSVRGAESGLQNVGSLPDAATLTGNLTFFPKVDVLIVNPAVLGRLTDSQQAILRAAVAKTTQHVLDTAPSEATLQQEYCEDGGRVVLASDANLAAFQQAAQPVYTDLETDPGTKAAITAILAIKAQLPSSQSVAACEPSFIFINNDSSTAPTKVDFDVSTKIVKGGSSVTLRFKTNPAVPHKSIQIWIAKKANGRWGAFTPHASVTTDDQGFAYYVYRASSGVWESFVARLATDASSALGRSPARQVRWK